MSVWSFCEMEKKYSQQTDQKSLSIPQSDEAKHGNGKCSSRSVWTEHNKITATDQSSEFGKGKSVWIQLTDQTLYEF